MDKRELRFVDYSLAAYLKIFNDLFNDGKRNFLIRGFNDETSEFVKQVKGHEKNSELNIYVYNDSSDSALPHGKIPGFKIEDIDAIFLFIKDAPFLSSILIKYTDLNCTIVAPITNHYYKNRPALVNSIPKSGVHMLFECMKSFGYKEPKTLDLPGYYDDMQAGTFYNLQHMTLDYIALPYSQIKKFISSFSNSAVLFMVRDPRDVAVSLAHYVASLKDYHILKKYFEKFTIEQQITSVIKGEYPLPVYINKKVNFSGNIRDIMLLYANWIKYPLSNTIFLRYEELVGDRGGGSNEAQLNCIWRIQLALGVPGCPSDYVSQIYSKSTRTFRKGKIGSFRDEFTKEHHKFFDALPQDFMQLYGYRQYSNKQDSLAHANFRGCITLDIDKYFLQPILLEEDYRGFNIVFYAGRYYSLSKGIGRIDFIETNVEELAKTQKDIYVSDTIESARLAIDAVLNKNISQQAISGLHKEIKDVKNESFKNNGIIYSISDSIARIKQDIEALLAEKGKAIDVLKVALSNQDKTVELLKKNLACRNEAIAKLNSDIQERDKRIEEISRKNQIVISNLQSDNTQKNNQIDNMNSALVQEREKIASLQKDLACCNEAIAKLNSDIQERDKKIEEISRKNQIVMSNLQSDNTQKNNQIDNMNSALVQEREKIASLEKEIVNIGDKIEDMKKEAVADMKEMSDLRNELEKTNIEKESIVGILEEEQRTHCLKYKTLSDDFKMQSDYLYTVQNKLSDIESSSILKLILRRLKKRQNK